MQRPALFVIVALAASFAQSQTQEPTYEQTQNWIVSKIGEGGVTERSPDATTSYEKVSMDNCKLLYTRVLFMPGGYIPDRTIKWEWNVPLGKVQEVQARHYTFAPRSTDERLVTFKAPITGKETRTDKGVVGETTENVDISEGSIIFGRSPSTDEDSANRMKKALEHAVDLCKKVGEPF